MKAAVSPLPRRQIRALATDEIERAAALLHRCWHDAYRRQLPPRLLAGRTVDFWIGYLTKRHARCWVLWVGERAVALATVSSNSVDDLWVARRYRRRGYGRALLDEVTRQIAGRGFSFAQAGCEDFNDDAIGFFTHLGWQEIGREPLLGLVPGRQVSAVVFSRPVSGQAHPGADPASAAG
jgi:GNAT superfamily N-acetyltransferase